MFKACQVAEENVFELESLSITTSTNNYSIVKDSNADLTVGNWDSKIDP